MSFNRKKSSLVYPITMQYFRAPQMITQQSFFTFPLFSCPGCAGKVHCCLFFILSSNVFFCLPLFLLPFTVPCRIVFAKPEDLETRPNYIYFSFLTMVRRTSYSPTAAWIFLRPSSLVIWSFYKMFNTLREYLISMA